MLMITRAAIGIAMLTTTSALGISANMPQAHQDAQGTAQPVAAVRQYQQQPATDLELPEHEDGAWYEVVPNKAHGPFPVRGFSGYAD